jgi:hypothetical protein
LSIDNGDEEKEAGDLLEEKKVRNLVFLLIDLICFNRKKTCFEATM